MFEFKLWNIIYNFIELNQVSEFAKFELYLN
jgi:hypothetical protein